MAKVSGPTDQRLCFCFAHNEVVKVAAYLEPSRLGDPAGLHRLEASRPDQPLGFAAGADVIGSVEEDRWIPATGCWSSRRYWRKGSQTP